jgi:WD40 repeat protein
LGTVVVTLKQVGALGKPGEPFIGPSDDRGIPDERVLALVPAGDRVLTYDSWGVVRVRDIANGNILKTLGTKQDSEKLEGSMMLFGLSADETKLVTSQTGGKMRVWDLTSGTMLAALAHGNHALVALSPDGERVLSGDWATGTVRLWDVRARKEVRRLEGTLPRLRQVAFSPDGRYAAAKGEQAEAADRNLCYS